MSSKFRFTYPEGRSRALTFSYDDSNSSNLKLLEILDRFGMKCTFNFNSGKFNEGGMLSAKEASLFNDNEIASHTVSHPDMYKLSEKDLMLEIREDKIALEKISGQPVRGFSYPYGQTGSKILDVLKKTGMEYARTVSATNSYTLPDDFYLWHPSCHHRNAIVMLEKFKDQKADMPLLYIWGHAFEFESQDNWELMESICKKASKIEDTWFATNIQIKEYISAIRALVFTEDRSKAYNPSACKIWLKIEENLHPIGPGKLFDLTRKHNPSSS